VKLSLVKENNPRNCLSDTVREIPPSGIREFFDIVYSMPDCISLGVGEPDFITPWRISDSGIYAIRDGCTHYTPNRGLPELCDIICDYVEKKYRISYLPESEIIVTMGVSQGLDLALRSIINPGDEVILFEPCYVSYSANVSLIHGKPVIIPLSSDGEFAIDIDAIKKDLTPKTKAILLNYPANPTGTTIKKEILEKIAALAIEHNLIVISDELYSALSYDQEHFSILRIPGMKERTIYLNGFSKSHAMTGWRLGFVAGPEFLISMMLKIHQYTALCAPSISQYAAIEALEKGDSDVAKMCEEYRRRRNYIINGFNEIGLTCPMPAGAFYAFPNISITGLKSREFAMELLKKEKVAVVPGTAFGMAGENHIRCSYATSMENIKESLKRIDRFVKGLK
jgi:aminotransferase